MGLVELIPTLPPEVVVIIVPPTPTFKIPVVVIPDVKILAIVSFDVDKTSVPLIL